MTRNVQRSLWTPRLIALLLSFAWGIVAVGVGLNALIKSNQQQSALENQVPPPTQVTINVNDVFRTGVIVTTVSALIALLSFIFILLLFIPLNFRSLLIFESLLLAFCSVWLFAVQVPFTHFFRTRSAQVVATLGGNPVPDSLVQAIERQLGVTPVYKHIWYLRLVAILPWFTLLFTIIAAVVLWMAASRSKRENRGFNNENADMHTKTSTTNGTNSVKHSTEVEKNVDKSTDEHA